MQLGRVVLKLAGVSLAAVLASATGVGAGASAAQARVDPQSGSAVWTVTLDCEPGDEVRLTLGVEQGSTNANTSTLVVCSEEQGQVNLVASPDDGRLHPGRAVVSVLTEHFIIEGDETVDWQVDYSEMETVLKPLAQ